jgi:hypothetical protein
VPSGTAAGSGPVPPSPAPITRAGERTPHRTTESGTSTRSLQAFAIATTPARLVRDTGLLIPVAASIVCVMSAAYADRNGLKPPPISDGRGPDFRARLPGSRPKRSWTSAGCSAAPSPYNRDPNRRQVRHEHRTATLPGKDHLVRRHHDASEPERVPGKGRHATIAQYRPPRDSVRVGAAIPDGEQRHCYVVRSSRVYLDHET